MGHKIYKRLFFDAGKIIGTFAISFQFKLYRGYKCELCLALFKWYLEIHLYQNKQQLAGEL